MRNKATISTSMAFIIALILAVIMITFGISLISKVFSKKLDETVVNQACYQSIWMNSERRVPGIEVETVDHKCPTKYITFHKEYAEQEFESNPLSDNEDEKIILDEIPYYNTVMKNDVPVDTEKCENSDDPEACMFWNINKIISIEMARCWHIFHRGQKRVFSIYTKEKQCVVCSILFFDNEIREEYGDTGLIGFIDPESENYNLDLLMRNYNYLHYTGTENVYEYTLDVIDKTFEYPYYDYDVNHDYAIVFVALNENAVNLISSNLWEKVKTLLTGREDYEEEGNFVNILEFVRNEEVPLICDEWA
jgi:hypothetical protein